ncbi:MAG: glycerol-3-phosphate 1-O-acyltransferase PlsY [Candidatus Shapirobacteria bacterium]|jgi:glycerol-3-phosphate acyltransferase PlsY
MMDTGYFLVAILSFLSGSIPFGYILSKVKGVDITKKGSGNIGATNISRVFGIKWAILVGLFDVLKGAIPVYVAKRLGFSDWQLVAVCLFPVLGNVFNPWLGFKGGKGVSTTFGVLSVLLGWRLGLICLLVWIALLYLINLMSLTNLLLILFAPYLLYSLHGFRLSLVGFIMILIIWYSHRKNITRLISGQEPPLFNRP